ncbi:MAG TPA: GDSL-type esterase/lipase family protein [Thermoanaerobaculia bacterium]
MSRVWLWIAPLTVGIGAALLFGAGFVLALRGSIGDPIGEPPPPSRQARPRIPHGGAFRILVIGDSLAKGTGDESGKGFALDVLEAFRKRGPSEITNLAVNGVESSEVRTLVETSNVRALVTGADLILVSVGANDLSHALPRGGGAPAEVADSLAQARSQYVANLRAILQELRASNAGAPICALGLYDPFGEESGPGRLGTEVILQWNMLLTQTALSFPHVFVIPTFDLLYGRLDRLSADRYHPNRQGYAEIAARVLQAVPVS